MKRLKKVRGREFPSLFENHFYGRHRYICVQLHAGCRAVCKNCRQVRVYTCMHVQEDFERACPLSVPPEDPVVDGSGELLLMAGTPYNLTCVTRGAKPAAHIQWTKDGVAVEGAYHSTVSHTHTSAHTHTQIQDNR